MVTELLVGLNVIDDQTYQAYREAISPLLSQYGGQFGYDFKVAEVLKSPTSAPINRVFTLYFPDDATREGFFSNPTYLNIKQQYFEQAVRDTTIIATYQRAESETI